MALIGHEMMKSCPHSAFSLDLSVICDWYREEKAKQRAQHVMSSGTQGSNVCHNTCSNALSSRASVSQAKGDLALHSQPLHSSTVQANMELLHPLRSAVKAFYTAASHEFLSKPMLVL